MTPDEIAAIKVWLYTSFYKAVWALTWAISAAIAYIAYKHPTPSGEFRNTGHGNPGVLVVFYVCACLIFLPIVVGILRNLNSRVARYRISRRD